MPFGIDEKTKVIVQGITGHQGRLHTMEMLEYGTDIVGGISPGKGGQNVHGVPVFDHFSRMVEREGAECSVVFVPAPHCKEAVVEAIDGGIRTIVVVTEHVPIHDTMWMRSYAMKKGARIIGPNCPGLCIPGSTKIGIMPNKIFKSGKTAIISRSGTLTYEIVSSLTERGIGQRYCVGVGGDKVIGTTMTEALLELTQDKSVDSIVMVGEIGGSAEQDAAKAYADQVSVPMLAFIAGRTAPPDKRMGHAGAIISGISGTYQDKVRTLEAKGIVVCRSLKEIPIKLAELVPLK